MLGQHPVGVRGAPRSRRWGWCVSGQLGRARRSALTSMEPVVTSISIGKYIRFTAATIASTTRSRNSGSISRSRSSRRGQVADLDPYGRHAGQPQQVPGLGVDAAVAQPGAHHDLALHQRGQPLAQRRGDAASPYWP